MGKWMSMLQDFHFKIVHCPKTKHANVDTLSINLVGKSEVDEDFGNDIQDFKSINVEGSKFHPTKGSEIFINLFTVLIDDEEKNDGEHHRKERELIVYKIKAQP